MKRSTIAMIIGLLGSVGGFAQAATLVVDKGASMIKIDAKATGHSFSGVLKKYEVSAAGDEATLAPSELNLSWSFSNLDTDDTKRNAEMIKWLGGGSPEGSFKFSKSWVDKAGVTQCMGSLKINGVSKTISFPVKTVKNGDKVKVDGNVTIDYQQFGLPIIRAMAVMTVDPKVKVTFHLEGKMQ